MLSLANNVICRVTYGKKFDTTNERKGHAGESKTHEILKETQRLLGELNVADFYISLVWLSP